MEFRVSRESHWVGYEDVDGTLVLTDKFGSRLEAVNAAHGSNLYGQARGVVPINEWRAYQMQVEEVKP